MALGLTALLMGIVGRHMPNKTAKGAEEKAKWDAFRNYLKNIEEYQDMKQAGELFEKYLPYATAFGLDRTWIRKFATVPYTPVPPWYHPYGYGRPTYHGGSRPTGSSGSSGSGGTAPSLPSLDSAASGMAGGLESMSSGLTRMLNSTASTMRSTPPSSSSGRSSGGFSGGFSGGSSGGGGSRGFG
jgi:uncharacterized membrane protein